MQYISNNAFACVIFLACAADRHGRPYRTLEHATPHVFICTYASDTMRKVSNSTFTGPSACPQVPPQPATAGIPVDDSLH